MTRAKLCVVAAAFLSVSLFAADASKIRVERAPLGGTAAALAAIDDAKLDPEVIADRLAAHLARRGSVTVDAKSVKPRVQSSGIRPRLGHDVAIEYRSNGTPLQIKGAALKRPVMALAKRDDLATARAFLRENAGLMRLHDPDRELVAAARVTDDLGRGHIRFEQRFNDLPVWPAEVIVHLDRSGSVDLVDGAYVPTPRRITTKPLVDAAAAVARARAASNANDATPPELIVHAQSTRRPRLAWKLDVASSLLDRWTVVIDAASGAVLTRFRKTQTASVTGTGRDLMGMMRNINVWSQNGVFYMLDATKKMFDTTSQTPKPQTTRGAIFVADASNQPPTAEPERFPSSMAVVMSQSSSTWNIPDSVSASYLVSETYDYFLQRHNRNSIDGLGGSLTAIVRLGQGFQNAFWYDEQQFMVFGDKDRYAGSLDVIAHEMTHGVTAHTARLVYRDQSGALNEAFSDIFGEMAEARTNGSNDWILGSQLETPIRSMKDPNRFGDPATMSQFVHTAEDNGGVHINSGIINRAFYLLAEGLNEAIGKIDAEKIFYRALTSHLTRDSQFIDARVAAITSADELFGAGSTQSKKTAEAFDAVEIFASGPATTTPTIPVVSGTDSTLFVYRDSAKNAHFLGRRELQSDSAAGATLSRSDVSPTRPSVSANGALAVFVDAADDACLIRTDGTQAEQCLKLPSKGVRVFSVAMSPDGQAFSFVLLGADGQPENDIVVVDVAANTERAYRINAPVYDGTTMATVDYADSMAFTPDNRYLVFDAFNELETDGSPWGAWSIYALALGSGSAIPVVAPIEGLDIGWPQLGKTNVDLMTFEAYDAESGIASVISSNLDTGDLAIVAEERGAESSPSYTGDDRAIVYASGSNTPSGATLGVVGLAADHLTPTGNPTVWMSDAAFPAIYRRGTYSGPTTQPGTLSFSSASMTANEGSTATITVLRNSGNKGAASVTYATSNGSAVAGVDYNAASGTIMWLDGDMSPKTFAVRLLSDSSTDPSETLSIVLSSASGASLATPTMMTLTIADVGSGSSPAKPGNKRRSTRH